MTMKKAPGGLLSRLDGDALRLKVAPTSYFGFTEPGWSMEGRPFHDHDFFHCLEGEAWFTVSGRRFTLQAGKSMLVRTGDVVSAGYTRAGRFRVFAQHFDLRLYGREDIPLQLDLAMPVAMPGARDLPSTLSRVHGLSGKPGGDLLRHGLFLPILLDFLFAAWRGDRALPPETRRLHEVETCLRNHATEGDALGRAMALTTWDPTYTARKFAEVFGTTPKQYLIRLRLDMAKGLLETGLPVKQVAAACGFDDELYFSRLFKKKEGRPPTAHPKIL